MCVFLFNNAHEARLVPIYTREKHFTHTVYCVCACVCMYRRHPSSRAHCLKSIHRQSSIITWSIHQSTIIQCRSINATALSMHHRSTRFLFLHTEYFTKSPPRLFTHNHLFPYHTYSPFVRVFYSCVSVHVRGLFKRQ